MSGAILHLGGRRFDMRASHSLARAVRFDDDGEALAFGIPPAKERPFTLGDFVGDVRKGGSVNCKVLELCAHGVGTHTESAGHLVARAPSPYEAAPTGPVLAQLLRVTPEANPGERYRGNQAPEDRVVSAASLADVIDGISALVVDAGTAGRYSSTNPPYFTEDAMELLRARGVDHLLTELPSVDREDDGGGLYAHRAFFDLDDVHSGARTITELCALGGTPAGLYALSLQVPALVTDAVPSRPILFDLIPDGAPGDETR